MKELSNWSQHNFLLGTLRRGDEQPGTGCRSPLLTDPD